MPVWHALSPAEAAAALGADREQGLSDDDASRRLAQHGPNSLPESTGPSALRMFASQFASLLVAILMAAAILAGAMGELTDAIAIVSIVVLNAIVGFVQERNAANALAALRKMSSPTARVRRAGRNLVIPAADLVPGDTVVLEAGDRIPADLRLIRTSGLQTAEAALTGESEAVEKNADSVAAPDAAVGDRLGMAWTATNVASGLGEGLVVATGASTEFGRIAGLVAAAADEETPLQARLRAFGKVLVYGCLALVTIVFLLGLLRGIPPLEMLLTSVSLAVAAVPEGLPAVVTIALGLGVWRLAKRGTLVRRLASVETLGATTVICTDKTGTLTVGQMTVRTLVALDDELAVTGEGYAATGRFERAGAPVVLAATDPLFAALTAAVACSTARVVERDGRTEVAGDPTAGSLLAAALKAGIKFDALDAAEPVIETHPFDSTRKRMSVVRRASAGPRSYVKGAPEAILPFCTAVLASGGARPMTPDDVSKIAAKNEALAGRGLRVLALSRKDSAADPESGLTFLGLAGMQDPPRAEAKAAVIACRAAGIRVVMITGDHPGTALAIARELGIASAESEVLAGPAVQVLGDPELAARVDSIGVFARVSPEHKLRIVRAWKSRGAVVAMTGDGVNDAPALKTADIGIAMGKSGTDVAKEASSMVITDDNFATIVAAIEEGRGIYENIRKTLLYLLSGNFGEILVMAVAVIAGWPLPLVPIQLLWINLVTDGFPALALATDPADRDLLKQPPRKPGSEIADPQFLGAMVMTGLLDAACTLGTFAWGLFHDGSLEKARTYAFSTLVIAEVLRSFSARSRTRVLWEVGVFLNLRLALVGVAIVALQVFSHHSGILERFLHTGMLSWSESLAVLGVAFIPVSVLEITKLVRRFIGRSHA
ncbi:MAG: cation-translocating P-type ATPase [Planctomycetes bacterium]|nr:cation-translocating P-type ATPase [Planctomycetota bacterium]